MGIPRPVESWDRTSTETLPSWGSKPEICEPSSGRPTAYRELGPLSSHCRTQVGEGCASRWVSLQVSSAVSEGLVAVASPAASNTTPRCCLAHPADRWSVATDDYWA